MAIRSRTLDAYAGIQELAAWDDSVLADKISRLIIWYSLQKKDLTEEDKNYLDASLVECYGSSGIRKSCPSTSLSGWGVDIFTGCS